MSRRAYECEYRPMEFKRSLPWEESEYIRVDGFPLVYTETVREGFRVRLPGCRWTTVEKLKAAGCAVVMPRVRRVD